MEISRKQLGYIAEEQVCEQLLAQGWQILDQNFQRKGTELDIVACKGSTLAIVEVKSRQHPVQWLHEIETLMNFAKLKSLRRGVNLYLRIKKVRYKTIRLDLAVVSNKKTQYFAGIVSLS